MHRWPLVIVACLVCANAQAEALDCGKAPGLKTEVELKPVRGEPSNLVLNLTFIKYGPSNAVVDKLLRECAALAIKRDPSKDILISAWLRERPGNNPSDDKQIEPYGQWNYFVYDAKTKSLVVRNLIEDVKNARAQKAAPR